MKPRNAVMCNFSLLKMVKFIKMGASMPQQLCPLWVCMFTEVSCVAAQFLTPLPLPTLCCSSCAWQRCLRAPLRPAVGTGKSWDTARLAQNQEVSPSGFLLRLLYCWVLGFFVFSLFFFFFLNEDLLFETYWKNCYRFVLFPTNRLHCNTCWRRVLR